MLIALIDTETSGLDPAKDALLEVAVVTFDSDHNQPVEARSWLIQAEKNPAESINDISEALLHERGRFGSGRSRAALELAAMLADAGSICAWNAAFDRPWVEAFIKHYDADVRAPWVCAMDDMTWPKPSPSRSLMATALAHGVGVMDAHRALADVLTMVRLFQRAAEMGCDVAEMVRRGLRPKSEYAAIVTYEQREVAKKNGFRWDGDRKLWVRKLFDADVAGELFPFRISRTAESEGAES